VRWWHFSNDSAHTRTWTAIVEDLQEFLYSGLSDLPQVEAYFSIQRLSQFHKASMTTSFMEYLIEVAELSGYQRLLPSLIQMFDWVIKLLLIFRKESMKTNCQAIAIPPDFSPGGNVIVKSLYDVLHVVSIRAMLPNRSLGEYIIILYLLRLLVFRFTVHQTTKARKLQSSTTMTLFVSFTRLEGRVLSKAVVSFSLTGSRKKKQISLRQRFLNLPLLNEGQTYGLKWSPGNCAECETFAYIPPILEHLRRECGQNTIFSATLALNMLEGVLVPCCCQCSELAMIIRRKTNHQIIDLGGIET